jgi:hypothetical protein
MKDTFPETLMIRDTETYDGNGIGGFGQRIFTTAGFGYEKVKYVRADILNVPYANPCPHCNKQLKLPYNTLQNTQSYLKPLRSITRCCQQLVTVHPCVHLVVSVYKGGEVEDDWGRQVTKSIANGEL